MVADNPASRLVDPSRRVTLAPPFLAAKAPEAAAKTLQAYLHNRGYPSAKLAFTSYGPGWFWPRDAILFDRFRVVIEEANYAVAPRPASCAMPDPAMAWQQNPRRIMAEPWRSSGAAVRIEGKAILCYHRFSRVYYHWHFECLFSLYLALRDDVLRADVEAGKAVFLTPRMTPMHIVGVTAILRLFGLGLDAVFQCDMEKAALYCFDEFVVPSALLQRTWLHPAVAEFAKLYRAAIFADIPAGKFAGSSWQPLRKLYISRRDARARRIRNEAELEQALTSIGFNVVALGEMSYLDQIKLVAESELILSPHGSGFTNLLFAQEGTLAIEIRADRHQGRSPMLDRSPWVISHLLHMPYGFIMCGGNEQNDEWDVAIDLVIESLSALGYGAAAI